MNVMRLCKKELRKIYLDNRIKLNSTNCVNENFNEKIINFIKNELTALNNKIVHCYLSMEDKHEIPTKRLIELLEDEGAQIVIPKTNFETKEMTSFYLKGSQIKKNNWGVPEPVTGRQADNSIIDIVIIPLIVFDKNGHRIGYGKGFYDRFLASLNPSVIKIGLSIFDPINQIDDIGKFDVKMDYCITNDNIYRF